MGFRIIAIFLKDRKKKSFDGKERGKSRDMEGLMDIKEISYTEKRDTLRRFRDQGTRHSILTYKLAKSLLESSETKLGDERWDVTEQIFYACIDMGNNDLAEKYLQKLTEQFPDSKRVSRLGGILQEADGDVEDAEEVYKENIKADPTDAASTKRIISLYKAQGKTAEAVKELNKYLQIFQCDVESWMELAEIYLADLEYEKAAFCYEELILLNPANFLIHQRYAETRATIGGLDNYLIAKTYFCQAARLSGNVSNRALWGIVSVSEQLRSMKGVSQTQKDECLGLIKWAKSKLAEKYEKAKLEIADNCPQRNQPKVCDHVNAGVEAICAILDGVKV